MQARTASSQKRKLTYRCQRLNRLTPLQDQGSVYPYRATISASYSHSSRITDVNAVSFSELYVVFGNPSVASNLTISRSWSAV